MTMYKTTDGFIPIAEQSELTLGRLKLIKERFETIVGGKWAFLHCAEGGITCVSTTDFMLNDEVDGLILDKPSILEIRFDFLQSWPSTYCSLKNSSNDLILHTPGKNYMSLYSFYCTTNLHFYLNKLNFNLTMIQMRDILKIFTCLYTSTRLRATSPQPNTSFVPYSPSTGWSNTRHSITTFESNFRPTVAQKTILSISEDHSVLIVYRTDSIQRRFKKNKQFYGCTLLAHYLRVVKGWSLSTKKIPNKHRFGENSLVMDLSHTLLPRVRDTIFENLTPIQGKKIIIMMHETPPLTRFKTLNITYQN